MTSVCRILSCNGVTRRGEIMCAGHWARVPFPLRRRIREAWRTWTQSYGAEPAIRQAKLEAHRALAQEAIDGVVAQLLGVK